MVRRQGHYGSTPFPTHSTEETMESKKVTIQTHVSASHYEMHEIEVACEFKQRLIFFNWCCFQPMNVVRQPLVTTIFFRIQNRTFGMMWNPTSSQTKPISTMQFENFEEGSLLLLKNGNVSVSQEMRVVSKTNREAYIKIK